MSPEDPGHLLPDGAWRAVVAGAAERREQLQRPATGRLAAPDRVVPARSHGGHMPGGPRLGVIHSAETPLAAGYAYSIAANWFATQAATSAQVMIDPAETIRMVADDTVAYAVGPAANGFTANVEQAGRGAFSRAQWLTLPGLAQMANVADYMRDCRDRWGLPLRWATAAEIVRAKSDAGFRAGWCTHDDIRRVLGGTTHTDPGVNYPRIDLMALATGEDTMPTAAEIASAVLDAQIPRAGGKAGTTTLRQTLAWLDANLGALPALVASAVLDAGIQRQGPGAKGITTPRATVAWSDANLGQLLALLQQLAATQPATAGRGEAER